MRNWGGAGGGAAGVSKSENAALAKAFESIVSRVDVATGAVSTWAGESATSPGGASRPHSQLDVPKLVVGVVSSAEISQQEWASSFA
jgi:hypothetical protein